jgi:hypothetical protein
MLGNEPICVSSHYQDLAIVDFAIDRVESEGKSGERVHGRDDAN